MIQIQEMVEQQRNLRNRFEIRKPLFNGFSAVVNELITYKEAISTVTRI